jgi:hypothetical protein
VSSRIGDIYEQIKEPALRVLYRHWDETRGGRAAPAVVEIDPAGLPVLHGSLAVIDTAERLEPPNASTASGSVILGAR